MIIDPDGNISDVPAVIEKVKNILKQEFEPVYLPLNADFHFSTMEMFEKIRQIVPSNDYKPEDIAAWLHEFGFILYDFGQMQFEWLIKRA